MNKTKLTNHLIALFTVFIWGITFVCTKYLQESFTSMQVLFIRYVIAYVTLWILCPKTLKTKNKKEEWSLIIAGGIGPFLYQYLENVSVLYTSPSSVSFITATAPICTAILASKYLNEKLSIKLFVGMLISLVGIFFICFGDSKTIETGLLGDLIILVSVWLWAIYSVIIKKCEKYGYSEFLITRRMFFYSLVMMIPFMIKDAPTFNYEALVTLPSIINLGFLGIFASALCFVTWNISVTRLGATTTSMYLFISPLITLIAQALYDKTGLAFTALLGMFITLAGLGISQIDFKKKQKNS